MGFPIMMLKNKSALLILENFDGISGSFLPGSPPKTYVYLS